MRIVAVCLAVACLFSASAASACKGPKVIYEDDFQERDAGWWLRQADIERGAVAIGDGRLVMRSDPERNISTLNMAFRVAPDMDVCTTVRFVETDNPADSAFALVFWANEFDDHYNFHVRGNGAYWISRWSDGNWHSITSTAAAPDFKPVVGEDIQLRVLTKGQTVTVFLNDTQLARFRAPPPAKPVQFGLRSASFGKSKSAVEIRSIKVTTVQ